MSKRERDEAMRRGAKAALAKPAEPFDRNTRRLTGLWRFGRDVLLESRLLPEGRQFRPKPEVFRGTRRSFAWKEGLAA